MKTLSQNIAVPSHIPMNQPDVMAAWPAFLFRMSEFPCLKFRQQIDQAKMFLSLSPVVPGKLWDFTLKITHYRFLPHPYEYISLASDIA
jgi:hypothetical protein